MDFSPPSLITSFIVGSIGFVLLVFGKKTSRFLHMIIGAVLMIFPYFVASWIVTAIIAAVLLGVLTAGVRYGA